MLLTHTLARTKRELCLSSFIRFNLLASGLLFFFSLSSLAQVNYTWTGAVSTSFTDPLNWSPAGVPLNIDNIAIPATVNPCVLAATDTVNNLTLTNGTLDLGANTLLVTGTGTLSQGSVLGAAGTLHFDGGSVTLGIAAGGPTIAPIVSAQVLNFTSRNTTYQGNVSITKLPAGSTGNTWRGGNTFQGSFYLDNQSISAVDGAGDVATDNNPLDPDNIFNGPATFLITGNNRIRIANQADAVFNDVATFRVQSSVAGRGRLQVARFNGGFATFNAAVQFIHDSPFSDIHVAFDAGTACVFNDVVQITGTTNFTAGALEIGRNGNVDFNDDVVFENNGTGTVSVMAAAAGTATLDGQMSIGAAGFNSGILYLRNFTSLSASAQTLTLGTGARMLIGDTGFPCVFNSAVTFSAGRIHSRSSTYNQSASFTKTSTGDDDGGNNVFFAAAEIIHAGSGGQLRFGTIGGGDYFHQQLHILKSGNGDIDLGRNFVDTYDGNIIVESTSATAGGIITFGEITGGGVLANGRTISVGPAGFVNGLLYLYSFQQNDPATAQNLSLGSTGTTLRLGNPASLLTGCTFAGNLIAAAGRITITGNTFQGTTQFTQLNTAADGDFGGNNFTGPVTIINSSAGAVRGSQTLAADTYQDNVFVQLQATGIVSIARSFSTHFPENIEVTSTSSGSFYIGAIAGGHTQAAGKNVTIGAAGFTGNEFSLRRFTQLGNSPITLLPTGANTLVSFGDATVGAGCTILGTVNVVSPNLQIAGNTFSAAVSLTKTGSVTLDQTNGGNTFNSTFTLINQGGQVIRFSNVIGDDVFNGTVTLNMANAAGFIVMGRSFTSQFNQNVICENTGGNINMGGEGGFLGTAILASGRTISFGTFNAGFITFRRWQQLSNTPQVLVTTGTGGVNIGNAGADRVCLFQGNLTATIAGTGSVRQATFERNVIISAARFSDWGTSNYNSLSGNTTITRIGGGDDDNGGGNTVNGNLTFINSGTGRFRTGVAARGSDTFLGQVRIENSGSGTLSFAYETGVTSMAADLSIANTGTGVVRFGEAATAISASLSGRILVTGPEFTNGSIILRYLEQLGGINQIVGSTSSTIFNVGRCLINGEFNLTNSGTSTLQINTFQSTATISVASLVLGGTLAQGNVFNAISTISKTGTANNDGSGGNVFNAATTLRVTSSGGRWRMGANDGDDFNGNLTIEQTGVGIFSPAYDAVSTISGNLILNNGVGIATVFGSGTGRLTFDGGTAQTVSVLSGNAPSINRLTINKSANEVTLLTPITVAVNFTPTSGNLNTTLTNILNLSAGASTTVGAFASYVNGPMHYAMANNANAHTTLNFPVGKDGFWRPVVLQVSHTAGTNFTYRCEAFNLSAEALGWTLPPTVSHVSELRYWDLDRLLTSTMVSSPNTSLRTATFAPQVTLYYDATQDEAPEPANLTICKNTFSALSAWIDIGGTVGAAGGLSTITSTSAPTAFNSFSRFTLANKIGGVNPLPVTLLEFKGESKPEGHQLSWSTAKEENHAYFDLEYSSDGISFKAIHRVYGEGNREGVFTYHYLNAEVASSKAYYRLRQVDNDGSGSYSHLISMENGGAFNVVSLYPNPSQGQVSFSGLASDVVFQCRLYDVQGQLVYSSVLNSLNPTVDISTLPSGTYLVELGSMQERKVATVVKY
jgi:fibronectin-binding autotransporter adhesin